MTLIIDSIFSFHFNYFLILPFFNRDFLYPFSDVWQFEWDYGFF